MSKWQVLNRPHIHVQNMDVVQRKLQRFIDAGPTRLQVLSDFDLTMTKQRTEHGGRAPNCFDIFNKCKSLPVTYTDGYKLVAEKYRPIEKDPSMSLAAKTPLMYEWWSKVSGLLVGFPFDVNEIDEVVKQLDGLFRDRCTDLFLRLSILDIPVLVFSAGLRECVESTMKHASILHPNVTIIANYLQYGRDGLLNGMKEPLITTCNKNKVLLNNSDYFEFVRNRDHIIVLGDQIGDAAMGEGVPASMHTLKIGFLFDFVEENLEKYMQVFDIVLVDDQTMDVPRDLLALIDAQ